MPGAGEGSDAPSPSILRTTPRTSTLSVRSATDPGAGPAEDAERRSSSVDSKRRASVTEDVSSASTPPSRAQLYLQVLSTLLFAGILGKYTYTAVRASELARFEVEYDFGIHKLEHSFTGGFASKAAVGAAAAVHFATSQGLSAFPNVSFSEMGDFSSQITSLTQVYGLEWLPVVAEAERDAWEEYARGMFASLYTSAESVGRSENISGQAFHDQIGRGIYEFSHPTTFEGPIAAKPGRGFYVPCWQAFPLAPNWFILMFDLYSQAQRAQLITRVLQTGVQATSDMIYLVEASTPIPASFILTPVVVPRSSGRSKAWAEPEASALFSHGPTGSGKVVGFSGVLFLWQTVLARALPEHLHGIVAAVVSPSGAAHTYRLRGGQAVSLGQGLQLEGTFRSHERKLAADVTSDTWELWVYPTDELLQTFLTKEPMLRGAFVMAMVFIASLILHSWVLLRRSQRLTRIFRATDNLVDDIYPAGVKERLMAQKMSVATASGGATGSAAAGSGGKGGGGSADISWSIVAASLPPIADLFTDTTVLFSDIVGFTAWSSSVTAVDVFELLEALFGRFDQLAKTCGVFKVETIGDCYMVVSGLPVRCGDHAVRMATFAQAILRASSVVAVSLGVPQLQIRVGMHSGPVVAGVLRTDKSRFQLFGDTVNTASRMESTSLPGKIQMSESTAELLHAEGGGFSLVERGMVAAKGKGQLRTFWLGGTDEERMATQALDLVSSKMAAPEASAGRSGAAGAESAAAGVPRGGRRFSTANVVGDGHPDFSEKSQKPHVHGVAVVGTALSPKRLESAGSGRGFQQMGLPSALSGSNRSEGVSSSWRPPRTSGSSSAAGTLSSLGGAGAGAGGGGGGGGQATFSPSALLTLNDVMRPVVRRWNSVSNRRGQGGEPHAQRQRPRLGGFRDGSPSSGLASSAEGGGAAEGLSPADPSADGPPVSGRYSVTRSHSTGGTCSYQFESDESGVALGESLSDAAAGRLSRTSRGSSGAGLHPLVLATGAAADGGGTSAEADEDDSPWFVGLSSRHLGDLHGGVRETASDPGRGIARGPLGAEAAGLEWGAAGGDAAAAATLRKRRGHLAEPAGGDGGGGVGSASPATQQQQYQHQQQQRQPRSPNPPPARELTGDELVEHFSKPRAARADGDDGPIGSTMDFI